jgi:hypothetical protein
MALYTDDVPGLLEQAEKPGYVVHRYARRALELYMPPTQRRYSTRRGRQIFGRVKQFFSSDPSLAETLVARARSVNNRSLGHQVGPIT